MATSGEDSTAPSKKTNIPHRPVSQAVHPTNPSHQTNLPHQPFSTSLSAPPTLLTKPSCPVNHSLATPTQYAHSVPPFNLRPHANSLHPLTVPTHHTTC